MMKKYQKVFLYPEILRRGQPVMEYVVRKRRDGRGEVEYYLGVYHAFASPGIPADTEGKDHAGLTESRISKTFFDAFVAEARRNAKRYRVKKVKMCPGCQNLGVTAHMLPCPMCRKSK